MYVRLDLIMFFFLIPGMYFGTNKKEWLIMTYRLTLQCRWRQPKIKWVYPVCSVRIYSSSFVQKLVSNSSLQQEFNFSKLRIFETDFIKRSKKDLSGTNHLSCTLTDPNILKNLLTVIGYFVSQEGGYTSQH